MLRSCAVKSSVLAQGRVDAAAALPYEEARARLLIGATLRMLGDEESGRIEIGAARAGFERLGAAADARHAAALLQQRRASPRVLTDREVEVLRLVASGNSNRDIAGALHISEHTAARHVQNILGDKGVGALYHRRRPGAPGDQAVWVVGTK
jgi:DNA-binding CsgD family transcriptional regulator